MTDRNQDARVPGIRLVEAGQGRTLLCLHGIASASASFAAQLDGLSARRRVVAWDAPGYGGSADPEAPPGLAGYAAAAAAVIESLGAPAHLLGVAWGAAIACQLAQARPDLVSSLILIGGGRGDGDDQPAAAALRERVRELGELGPRRFAEQAVPRLLSPEAGQELVADAVGIAAAAVRLPGYRPAVESLTEADLRPLLASIAAPALLLCGDRDPITGERESRALQAAIRNSVQVTVAGAGHLANQERPGSVNEWIAAYLDIVEHLDHEREPAHAG